MLAIFKRELKTYFLTPTGYIFLASFLLITGIFFTFSNILPLNTSFAPYLNSILFLFLLCIPILTMRLMTDEKRFRTDQLLLTSPVKIVEIVLGKYFAAMVLFCIALGVTVLYAFIINAYGSLDTWESLGAYIGFVFLGGAFIAVGLYVSAATENQVVASIVTFGALLIVWVLDFIRQGVPAERISGILFVAALLIALTLWISFSTRNIIVTISTSAAATIIFVLLFFFGGGLFEGLIGKALGWLSLVSRYRNFSMGILKFDTIIYYLSFAAFFNFLTVRLIERRRWS